MESTDKSVGRAVLLIVISALSFGSISVLTVLITREHLPLITAMAWRYFLAGVILVARGRSYVLTDEGRAAAAHWLGVRTFIADQQCRYTG